MEVVQENVGHLSNYEVLSLLNETQNTNKKKQKNPNKNEAHSTVVFSTIKYLSNSPCSIENPDKIKNFMKAVQPYKLTECEKLAMVNLIPTTPIEMQLIIEASEEGRLTDDEIPSLLELVKIHLGEGVWREN